MGDLIFEWGVRPMGRDISFDGGGGTPHASHPCSEELKKCPPPSAVVQRLLFVKENLDRKKTPEHLRLNELR